MDNLKVRGKENCTFEHEGCCFATLCYSDKKCRARNIDGSDWCWAEGQSYEDYLKECAEMDVIK